MEKRRKKINLKYVVIILSLIVFLSMSMMTFAWFTDSKNYSGDLTFGSLELDVSGGVDEASKTLKFSTARQTAGDSTWTGKIMPGDVVNIPLNVSLTSTSEPAYYLVHITDEKNIFENAFYFSDGTNIYVNDGIKTYKQGDSLKTPVSDKYVGKLEKNTSGHDITIGAVVSTSATEQGVKTTIKCDVYAIQQANLEISMAKYILALNFRTPLTILSSRKMNITVVDDYTVTSSSENTDTYFSPNYTIEPGTTYRVSFMATLNTSGSWSYYYNGMISFASILKNGYNEQTFKFSRTKPEILLWDDSVHTYSDPFTITNMMIEIVG